MSGAFVNITAVQSYHLSGVNWADIPSGGSHANANQTMAGITTTVTLKATGQGDFSMHAIVNGSDIGGIVQGGTFPVNPGDLVHFLLVAAPLTGTCTIVNVTDANTTVDTFGIVYP